MKELLQRIGAFLLHVIDAPESAPDTQDAAKELLFDVEQELQQHLNNDNHSDGEATS